MADSKSGLLNGGEEIGMTNEQCKGMLLVKFLHNGMLLDELEDWEEVLELAMEANDSKVQKKAAKQITKIHEKLKF